MSYSMRSGITLAVSVLAVSSAVVACTNSDGSNRLERIDGPAQVDPDFGGLDDGTVVEVDDGSNESESGG